MYTFRFCLSRFLLQSFFITDQFSQKRTTITFPSNGHLSVSPSDSLPSPVLREDKLWKWTQWGSLRAECPPNHQRQREQKALTLTNDYLHSLLHSTILRGLPRVSLCGLSEQDFHEMPDAINTVNQ